MPANYVLCKEGWVYIQRRGVKWYSSDNYSMDAYLMTNASEPDWTSLIANYPPPGGPTVAITSSQWADYTSDPEGPGLVATGPSLHMGNYTGAEMVATGFVLRIQTNGWIPGLVAVYKFATPITVPAGGFIDRTPIVGVSPCV